MSRSLAATDGIGAAQAQAWLALLGTPTAEVVILPNKAKRNKPERSKPTHTTKPMLSVYPNPAKGPIYLVYQVPAGVEQAEVRLHDAEGRLVRTERVAPKDGIVEVTAAELATGLHIATLYYDGIQVGTAKVSVVR